MGTLTHDMPLPIQQERSARTLTRRHFLAGAGAVAGALAVDGVVLARHSFEVLERTVRIARLPAAFHGFRVAQLSDIHLDDFTEPAFLQLVLHHINQLSPDLVLLTGDFASHLPKAMSYSRDAILRCAELLRRIGPPRYAVLGNHDNGIGADFVIHALTSTDTPVLFNRHVPIERDGQRLWLGGIDDPATGIPILDLAVPRFPDAPVLLMCHSPDFADTIIRHPRGALVDLMFSGHTHGGQICLPFFGPLSLPPLGNKYVSGLFQFEKMQLYVNRGIGTVGLPIRLNCAPEISLITLQTADA